MRDSEKSKLTVMCSRVYSPSSPVDRLDLFAGRTEQVKQIAKAITTRGRHAIMYGERGVGKTSLATVMKEMFDNIQGMLFANVNCVESDTFQNAWLKILSEIEVIAEPSHPDENGSMLPQTYTLDQYADPNLPLGPGEVRKLLQRQSSSELHIVLVFDEFDRLDPAHRAPFADTIKDLSDNSLHVTILLVGVARDVTDLVIEHASISRCLAQILMPPMNKEDLKGIIDKANKALDMTMDDDAVDLIVGLSQGLAHYTHLIAQESTYKAIESGRRNVTLEDVSQGIYVALESVDQMLRSTYVKASQGQKASGTLFPQILLACALSEVNELGEFRPVDIREPLRRITDKKYEIQNYSQHLDKLSRDTSRGPVLKKEGSPRKFRFRFINPLLKPFILMKGLTTGQIDRQLINLAKIQSRVKDDAPPMLF